MPPDSAASTAHRTIHVALIGNPNTGKSTLFNALAGLRQRVGNYPGVTVEKRVGYFEHESQQFALVDLPGTYSLSPRSPDELLVFELLLGKLPDQPAPDVILCIVDASNLERNLYLVSQLLELGKPIVIALNMMDLAEQAGWQINIEQLQQRLGVPVVPIQAHRRIGLDKLKQELLNAVHQPAPPCPAVFPDVVDRLATELQRTLRDTLQKNAASSASARNSDGELSLCLVRRLLLDVGGAVERTLLPPDENTLRVVREAREQLKAAGVRLNAVEAISRYDWIRNLLDGAVRYAPPSELTLTDRVDRILTHKLWGTLVLAAVMLAVFLSIFRLAEWPMDWIDRTIAGLGEALAARLPQGAIRSLLVDGVIAGVGAVVVFLPQIMLLFLFIGILEDCGYMARAAFLMDKLMQSVGLSGKSFIPLLSSFACAVPGIMSARVIENPRDRLATILVAPLMSCSARLPVYTVLIAAFVPTNTALGSLLPGLVLFAMYVLGIVVAVAVAWVLKRTLLRGQGSPFVMELPVYKVPSPQVVFFRVFDRSWAFLKRAGTIIFAVSIVIWALSYYPRDHKLINSYQQRIAALTSAMRDSHSAEQSDKLAAQIETLEAELQAELLKRSVLGRLGRAIEPIVRPAGWDWRIGCAVVASFPAREVVISVLGVIYGVGEVDTEDESSAGRLVSKLRNARWDDTGEPVFNLPVALSLMVFFALCAQCASTLVVLAREAGHWRWSVFTFTYMTVLAYLAAVATYRVGTMLGW